MSAENVRNFLRRLKEGFKNHKQSREEKRALKLRFIREGMISLIIGLLILVYNFAGSAREDRAFQKRGIRTDATLIKKDHTPDSNDWNYFWLTLSFKPLGLEEMVDFYVSVDEETYNLLEVGIPIEIEYLPENPQKARIYGWPTVMDRAPYCALTLAVIFSALLYLILRYKLEEKTVSSKDDSNIVQKQE